MDIVLLLMADNSGKQTFVVTDVFAIPAFFDVTYKRNNDICLILTTHFVQ